MAALTAGAVLCVLHGLPDCARSHNNGIRLGTADMTLLAPRRYFAPDLQRPGQYATMVPPSATPERRAVPLHMTCVRPVVLQPSLAFIVPCRRLVLLAVAEVPLPSPIAGPGRVVARKRWHQQAGEGRVMKRALNPAAAAAVTVRSMACWVAWRQGRQCPDSWTSWLAGWLQRLPAACDAHRYLGEAAASILVVHIPD